MKIEVYNEASNILAQKNEVLNLKEKWQDFPDRSEDKEFNELLESLNMLLPIAESKIDDDFERL
ncbi:MAG TPA: hypothetical protein VKX29_02955 [Brumimicrobium sp.]|nr:hypothetical protein [Brumimicrobium sp.]